jgi:hypothetical protein
MINIFYLSPMHSTKDHRFGTRHLNLSWRIFLSGLRPTSLEINAKEFKIAMYSSSSETLWSLKLVNDDLLTATGFIGAI